MASDSKGTATDAVEESPELPEWANRLRDRFVSGASALFVLHGNVHDLVRWKDDYLPLSDFLSTMLARTKDTVLFYDVASGLRFGDKNMEQPFRNAVNARRLLEGRAQLPLALPRDPYRLFPWIETFLRDTTQHGAFILEYAETVSPAGDVSFMGEQDRAMRVTLQRWASDPGVLATDNIIILITENLADLDRNVRSAPRLTSIEIPLPDAAERHSFAEWNFAEEGKVGMAAERVAHLTAGLTNFQIENLFRSARAMDGRLSTDVITERKREFIERECFGLVEFMDSSHDFTVVGGMEKKKAALRRVVAAIKKGDKERVPMGVLGVGPMGTGKSFLMEAFANECGMTSLKLKNFRDKWVGSTEGNLEKILTIVKALGNVMVVIDEGDRSIGGQGAGDNDGGVNSRVTARLKEFMSDTGNRGNILFVMMTNRPDKLDADMKRPGRFDMKLPFFPPQTEDARIAITKALLRKNKIRHRINDYPAFARRVEGMTGAEIEAVLLNATNFADDDDRETIGDADLLAAADDFIPSRDDAMMRYMELLAVFECSSRQMLPDRYKAMSSEDLNADIRRQQHALLRP
ncbi:MAG: ATP-binding protein [Deltaproteobacteria bacterium]|nr:ATP-binding protein [Deltaproteobacteria bacterium]